MTEPVEDRAGLSVRSLIVKVFPDAAGNVTMRRSDVSSPVEARMHAEEIEYRPMPFEEYLELPRDIRAEWVDGVALVTPSARLMHQLAEKNLMVAIDRALTDIAVACEVGVRTGPRRYRIGDVVALALEDVADVLFTENAPLIVVEVLSPSTRREDTIRKSTEYFDAGVGQYWILDRDEPTLLAYARSESGWDEVLVLDAAHPTGSVIVGERGSVELDLNALTAM